jgi:hypothetical protein
MAVAKAIFSKPETIKPSLISGIGFDRETSGSVPDLEKSLKLDAESIAARVMQQLNASS